jgi:hypothetical protein
MTDYRIRLTPSRWGWNSNVSIHYDDTWIGMELEEAGWWRPTKRSARAVARRWIKRAQARDNYRACTTEERP